MPLEPLRDYAHQPVFYLDINSLVPQYVTGQAGAMNVLGYAWSPSLLMPVTLTVDASGNLNTSATGVGTFNADVTDRAGRLLGVTYGSQGQQIKQSAANFNTVIELAAGATLYDARQIRALTAADVLTANLGTIAGAATEATLATMLTLAGFQARVNTQGQKTMAASTPVVLASDQAAIPVNTKTDLAPAVPTTATVGVASASAVAANAVRKGLHLRNTSTGGQRVSLSMNGAAVLDNGITLYPQDVFEMDEYDFDLGAVNAIASAAAARLSVQEFS